MAKTCGRDAFWPIGSVPLLLLHLLSGTIPGNGRKADFKVLGPSEPVWAMVGGNVDLPCYLSPEISAEDMELRWYRDQPSPAVHVHRKGKDVPEEQMALYQGRTTFLKDGVAQGRASVRIHNVITFDNGMFHCQFNDSTVSAEATLWLRVAGLGSEPRIQVQVDQDGVVQAECTSAGWYPEPQVEWRDFQGQTLHSETNISVSPTTGLWAVASSLTVPSKAVSGLACSVSSPPFPEKKVSRYQLSDPASGLFLSIAWKIVLSLFLAAAVLVAAITCLLRKHPRGKNGKLLEEEGAWGQRSGTCHCLVDRDPNSTGLPLQTMGAHAEPWTDFPLCAPNAVGRERPVQAQPMGGPVPTAPGKPPLSKRPSVIPPQEVSGRLAALPLGIHRAGPGPERLGGGDTRQRAGHVSLCYCRRQDGQQH
uniref:Ig-like domain-containing protein n=1 Tax=Equus caballus TaxID=9796 RepID=A0A3Q2GSI5_HORSE